MKAKLARSLGEVSGSPAGPEDVSRAGDGPDTAIWLPPYRLAPVQMRQDSQIPGHIPACPFPLEWPVELDGTSQGNSAEDLVLVPAGTVLQALGSIPRTALPGCGGACPTLFRL